MFKHHFKNMFTKLLIIALIEYIALITYIDSAPTLKVSGICGFPGEPISAHHSIENRVTFTEGETVNYQCVDFLSYKKFRTCHNGSWLGPQARCGYGVSNEVIKITITDCVSGIVIAEHSDITLEKNNDRFPNSFTSDRYDKAPIRAHNLTCYKWHLHLQDWSYFSFVRVDFAVVSNSVAELSKEVPVVTAAIGSDNLCVSDTQKKYRYTWTNKWITNSHKYHYYFNCNANNTKRQSKIIQTNKIILETKTRTPLTLDLIRFAIGKIYGSIKDAACGAPEVPISVNATIVIDQQLYQLSCAEPLFTNATNITSTLLKCSSDGLWHGSYPLCVPKKSCDKSLAIEKMKNTLIESVENAYIYNNTSWYAINGTFFVYKCKQNYFKTVGSKSMHCLQSGDWDTSEFSICDIDSVINNYRFLSSDRNSTTFLQLLPFYIITGITGFIVVIIGVFMLIHVRKRNNSKAFGDTKPRAFTLPRPVTTSSSVNLTDLTYLEDRDSIYIYKSVYSEPLYDIPPNRFNVVPTIFCETVGAIEPIYDKPRSSNILYPDRK